MRYKQRFLKLCKKIKFNSESVIIQKQDHKLRIDSYQIMLVNRRYSMTIILKYIRKRRKKVKRKINIRESNRRKK